MGAFLAAAAGFPTVLFSSALAVVVVFWLLTALGAADHHGFHGHQHVDAWGMGGVPLTVAFSLLTAVGWFVSLSATVLLDPLLPSGPARMALGLAVLAGAALVAWWATRLLVRPLRRLFPDTPGPSRQDFVGLVCTVRTGRVDDGFGQAEVRAADGSSAVVQVRQTGEDARRTGDALTSGSTALLYAYDEAGEFFWVAPYDSALDPRPHSG
ncbi:hypothetical protein ACIRVK_15705 [Streptomyces sp. NPDC101152]|uniref:hypothetical protein n=1 Tax=Streptomyces sp. NPDC101152 TaxID=3366116 RepID=UPI0038071F06